MRKIGDKFIFRDDLNVNDRYGGIIYISSVSEGDTTIIEILGSGSYKLGNGYYASKEMHADLTGKKQRVRVFSKEWLKHIGAMDEVAPRPPYWSSEGKMDHLFDKVVTAKFLNGSYVISGEGYMVHSDHAQLLGLADEITEEPKQEVERTSNGLEKGMRVKYIGPRSTSDGCGRPDECVIVGVDIDYGGVYYREGFCCQAKYWERIPRGLMI